ncbi:MAG: DEAD/DEAH box helicase [Phycisphaerae bacterium]|nr:DEAD/DEAH box helicase [Phycisphaerae bacterium]
MPEIKLTPTGQLHWSAEDSSDSLHSDIANTFEQDWKEGLFLLAAEKNNPGGSQTLRYWQKIVNRYLTELCHIPESENKVEISSPGEGVFSTWVLTAPPMVGGEYISVDMLKNIWNELDKWVCHHVETAGSTKTFLKTRAPKWHQVGRVCFHLAENKADQDRPFAFMATYSTGFGSGGKLKHLPLRTALEQYSGAQNRKALINLLSPVQQAASGIPWVSRLVDSSQIYQPMAWGADSAYKFLRSADQLEYAGLMVRLPNWWKKKPRPTVSITIGEKKKSKLGTDAMLDFNVGFMLGDEGLTEQELKELLEGDEGLVWFKGQWVEVDRDKLQEAVEHWEKLRLGSADGDISFIEGMRMLAGASADLLDNKQTEQEKPWVHVSAGDAMRQILSDLRDPASLNDFDFGKSVQATLRPYQEHGVAWLNLQAQLGLGACLADDMGLGKTLQVLTLLSALRNNSKSKRKGPSLLVLPASLLGNWRQEAQRFTPSLKLTFLHPAENDRKKIKEISETPKKKLAKTDLAVTTYSMLTRQKWLSEINWNLVILDEAQAIKNHSTRQSKAAKKLSANSRIALTGTPVENRLGDLWSLFDFLNPGLLGSAKVFKGFIKNLQQHETDQFGPLRKLVSPYILRRLKTDRSIISDLPEKIETSTYCKLSKKQVKLYGQAVKTLKSALDTAEGIARRGVVLQYLMHFKQICNHPSQLTGDGEYNPKNSGKFLRLKAICEEIASRQEKVLIFTQFREITDPLSDYLSAIFGRSGLILHGGVPVKKRKLMVDQFQSDDGPPFFILSLKAGGTGLNLTAASHIIHFDRWWNPAVENQATDRAFRIGQKRNVLVHKFVTDGTIEEKIAEMITEKQKMADGILASDGGLKLTEMSDEQLMQIVRLDITRAQL